MGSKICNYDCTHCGHDRFCSVHDSSQLDHYSAHYDHDNSQFENYSSHTNHDIQSVHDNSPFGNDNRV